MDRSPLGRTLPGEKRSNENKNEKKKEAGILAPMKIGFVQFEPVLGLKEKNRERIVSYVREARKRGAHLLVFPELALSGYFMTHLELGKLAERVPGEATGEIARACEGISAVVSLPEKDGEKYFITSVLLRDGRIVGKYRKSHLFEKEKLLFSPGSTGYEVFSLPEAKVGLLICYDWWFPESSRTLALKGAEILCYSACLIKPYAVKAIATRAVENRVFVILSSRVGRERGVPFQGQSQIASPTMEILASAGEKEETMRIVDIDPREAKNKKVIELSDLLKDRREELYFK